VFIVLRFLALLEMTAFMPSKGAGKAAPPPCLTQHTELTVSFREKREISFVILLPYYFIIVFD
jgi:hypothetical protein